MSIVVPVNGEGVPLLGGRDSVRCPAWCRVAASVAVLVTGLVTCEMGLLMEFDDSLATGMRNTLGQGGRVALITGGALLALAAIVGLWRNRSLSLPAYGQGTPRLQHRG